MADGSGSSAPAPAEAFDLRAVNYRYDSNNAVGLYLYLAALVFCGWHLYERWSIEKRLAQRLSALERELGVRRRMLRLSLYLFISLLTRSVWFWLRESGIFDDSCKTDIECPWTVLLALDKFSVLIQFFAFTVLGPWPRTHLIFVARSPHHLLCSAVLVPMGRAAGHRERGRH